MFKKLQNNMSLLLNIHIQKLSIYSNEKVSSPLLTVENSGKENG